MRGIARGRDRPRGGQRHHRGACRGHALGIPLTHRALCHGAILVTGHEREGAATDWNALARTGLPLVIYMGVARAGALQTALLEAGMPPSMAVAVVANATSPHQRSIVTTLDRLAMDLERAGIASPAIILVGEVASLAQRPPVEALAWSQAACTPGSPRRPR